MRYIILTLAIQILLTFESVEAEEFPTSQELDPTDFAINRKALQGLQITQFGGNLIVECDAFANWLDRTGRFGKLVALADHRDAIVGGLGTGQVFDLNDENETGGDVPDAVFGNENELFPEVAPEIFERVKPRKLKEEWEKDEAKNVESAFDAVRISDIAYQVLHDNYDLPAISYRDSLKTRNECINRLLLKIGEQKNEK
jgi:hypothetical protein